MTRLPRGSPTTRWPWPADLAFGVAGFAAIRWGLPPLLGKLGEPARAVVAKVLASGAIDGLAWLVLLAGVVAAVLSLRRSGRRAQLREVHTHQRSVQSLTWAQFERLVGEAYRRRGYRVEPTGVGGPDYGHDLLLAKDGETTLLVCRHWRADYVGVADIRAMHELMQQHRATAGKIVCSGVFSSDCYRFAVGKPLELIDGEALQRFLAPVRADTTLLPPAPAVAAAAPACPLCRSPTEERTNRTTGEAYWGCSRYPDCWGTVPREA